MTASPAPARPRRLPQWLRWLHIYVSMAAFAATFLFAVTGLTLNHASWFEAAEPEVHKVTGTLPVALLQGNVDKLAVAERLRAAHGLRGTVSEFVVDDAGCVVVWKGPGYSADANVQRGDGSYEIEVARKGFVAVLDDLHKGRDCGPAWSLFVDLAAVVLAAVAITGGWLLLYLSRWRRRGLLVAGLGAAAVLAFFLLGVA